MRRTIVLLLLTGLTASASVACDTARAAALIGDTRHVYAEPLQPPPIDSVKEQYRRPDTIPFPQSNPYTPAKASLGHVLFFDTRLSGSGGLSCAYCHNPGFSYGDGRAKGLGEGMKPLDRRVPAISNSAWGALYMWDGRATSLEDQALDPLEAPREMHQSLDRLVQTLSGLSEYKPLFAAAFPRQAIGALPIAEALATYERTIVSPAAPFDAWIEGDDTAISDAARRGFDLFNNKARCASCHGGWTMTDDGFHDTGLPGADPGRGAIVPNVLKMQHAFKTPGLRNVARRAPFMHDGSLPTLDAVVAHYNHGGLGRPSQSELITPLGLSAGQQADLVAFLQSLGSTAESAFVPTLPR